MPKFTQNSHAVVIGASGGIGRAMLSKLISSESFSRIFALSRNDSAIQQDARIQSVTVDILDAASLASVAARIKAEVAEVHLVFIATGILHAERLRPEKRVQQISAEALSTVFAVNAIGPMLAAQAFAPIMSKHQSAVMAAISARVGSISDNRAGGWYSYRSSKAALNMLYKTFAIEMRRVNPNLIVSLLHPGTTDTNLSKPFQTNVPADKLFRPEQSAAYLYQVMENLTTHDSGQFYAWDGTDIEW